MTDSTEHRLDEGFDGPGLDPRLSWRNPPVRADLGASRLTVATAAGTDFWQRTHYGFCADNGHVWTAPASQGFCGVRRRSGAVMCPAC